MDTDEGIDWYDVAIILGIIIWVVTLITIFILLFVAYPLLGVLELVINSVIVIMYFQYRNRSTNEEVD